MPTACDDIDPSGVTFTVDSPGCENAHLVTGCLGCHISGGGDMAWNDDFECFTGSFQSESEHARRTVFVTLCCLSDGDWQISLFCGDDQRVDETTLIDNGDGTWTATGTWTMADFADCCCPDGDCGEVAATEPVDLTINGLYGTDCPAATSTPPPS